MFGVPKVGLQRTVNCTASPGALFLLLPAERSCTRSDPALSRSTVLVEQGH
jgi:hypothetical protein